MYSKDTLIRAKEVGAERVKAWEHYIKLSQEMKHLCHELRQNIEFEKDLRPMEEKDLILGQIVFGINHSHVIYTLVIDELFKQESYDTKFFGAGGSSHLLSQHYVMKD